MDSKTLAASAAWLADQKKGLDIRAYEVGEHLRVADYFVVITGMNRAHIKALSNEIHVRLKAAGETHSRPEGDEVGWWILLDYSDVVVHLLQAESREYYGLDDLYGHCPQLDWKSVELPALPDPREPIA